MKLENQIDYIKQVVGEKIGMESKDIDPDVAFFSLGITSLISEVIIAELSQKYDDLSPTLLFEYPNARKLGTYLMGKPLKHGESLNLQWDSTGDIDESVVLKSCVDGRCEDSEQICSVVKEINGGNRGYDIAVIGLSGRFPRADNPSSLWENLIGNKDCIEEIPEQRWNYLKYFSHDKESTNTTYSKWGGFINDVDKFDPLFFHISPKEAELMDPQQKLFLMCSWEAMEDAGYARAYCRKTDKIGVYAGVTWNEFSLLTYEEGFLNKQYKGQGSLYWGIPNRVSYFFNFTGPSIAIDTACSSSLVAIHEACKAIISGDCEMALAGGVNLNLHPNKYVFLSQSKFLSPDGRCRSFGEEANGYVPGEGVAVVLLKPLDKAIADNDNIYGVIRGTATNHGGKATGYTVPNPEAHKELIINAIERAAINPEDISYIECHGTGTALGDPIEIKGLSLAFEKYTKKRQFCGIGSIKSSIGHLEAAAGVTGLIKILLCMKYRKLPASIHANVLNKKIKFDDTPFYVVRENQEWQKEEGKSLLASVSSFGAGGSNAHVIVESYTRAEKVQTDEDKSKKIVAFSAQTKAQIIEYVEKILAFISGIPANSQMERLYNIENIAGTLKYGREFFMCRVALLASDITELKRKLEDFISTGGKTESVFFSEGSEETPGNTELENNLSDLEMEAFLWAKCKKNELNDTENTYLKVSLPTYPFLKERSWISDREILYDSPVNSIKISRLHPLIDANFSTYKKGCFKKTFMKTEFFFKDHMVNDNYVLPGVCHLEIAKAGAELWREENATTLRNVWYSNPIIVGDSAQDVEYEFISEGEKVRYTVKKSTPDGVMKFSEGEVGFESLESMEKRAERVNPEEFMSGFNETLDAECIYRLFSQIGIFQKYGFQVIREYKLNDNRAVAKLELPLELTKEFDKYSIHPSLMDGAVQTAMVHWISKVEKDKLIVPFYFREINVLRRFTTMVYVNAVFDAVTNKYDLYIYNSDGAPALEAKEFVIKEVSENSSFTGDQPGSREYTGKIYNNSIQKMLYSPEWEERKILTEGRNEINIIPDKRSVVIIYTQQGCNLKKALLETYSRYEVTEIELGEENIRYTETKWKIDIYDSQALYNCIQSFRHIDTIFFLGGLQVREFDACDINMLDESQENGVIALFRLVKVLRGCGLIYKGIKLAIITNNVYRVADGDIINPCAASMIGLAGVLAKEYSDINVCCIDISSDSLKKSFFEKNEQELIDLILKQEYGNWNNVAIRDGKTFIRKLIPTGLAQTDKPVFKHNGVYVILGGAGGIGIELSRYLAENFQANLVLIGRREPEEHQKEAICQIEKKGGKVLYLRADANDFDSMKAAIEKAKSKFGGINGVIHSAIVLRDRTLERMDEESFRAALEPKVRGSLILNKVVYGEKLDFILFFSSAVSFLLSPGQSNYAAGSTFEDAFALYLHQNKPYPVRVINWGFWGKVGIVATEDYSRRMKAQGIDSVEPEDGMEVIMRVLSNRVNQIMAMNAQDYVLRGIGVDTGKRKEIFNDIIPSFIDTIPKDIKSASVKIDEAYNEQAIKELDKVEKHLLLREFQRMNVFRFSGEEYNFEQLKDSLKIVEGYNRMFICLLDILERGRFIRIKGQSILSLPEVENENVKLYIADIENRIKEAAEKFPEMRAKFELLYASLNAYPEILTGKKSHMEVMFPNGSMAMVENIYRGNPVTDYYNQLTAQIVKLYIENRLSINKKDKICILEIGSGTGGTSKFVLDSIKEYENNLTYYYTDISTAFTRYGEEKFQEEFGFVRFKVLDIENDPLKQGFEQNTIDLIFASNVLHATKLIQNTLNQVKKLLKTNGLLVINELTGLEDFNTLVFGLTGGWWLYEDEENRIHGSPLLSRGKWKEVLENKGFKNIRMFELPETLNEEFQQSVIISESDGCVVSEYPNEENKRSEQKDYCNAIGEGQNRVEILHREVQGNDIISQAQNYVITVLSDVLKLDKGRIEIEETLENYGVDSLVVMELNKRFEKDFGKLPATLLFENVTVGKLSEYFIQKHPEALKNITGIEANVPAESHYSSVIGNMKINQNAVSCLKQEGSRNQSDICLQSEFCSSRDIAVIGVSGRYPGASDINSFWEKLRDGIDCVVEVPPERWDYKPYYSPDRSIRKGKTYSKWGGFIDDVNVFDPLFFKITPKDAKNMDPQQRLFLEIVWTALEDAGYTKESVDKSTGKRRIGVFAASMWNDYQIIAEDEFINGNGMLNSYLNWGIANRVSYHFDFHGPSVSIDTACSSSLVAVKMACESLRRGECKVAVAGGVNLSLHPSKYIKLSQDRYLSSDGKCRSFGEGGDGFVPGEGVGAVILKPFDAAKRDRDNIYAVIKGVAENHGGKTKGFTVPNPDIQAELIMDAIEDSGIHPKTISYIEAHGTGTALGDPIEIAGLTKAFDRYTSNKQFCPVGSCKSNFGHLEAASGLIALTKVLLMMKHKKLVPSLHCEKLNPNIDFKETPFYVQQELSDWKRPEFLEDGKNKVYPRRAGISSFGAGGSNAHIILEEWDEEEDSTITQRNTEKQVLIILSAKDRDRLKEYVLRFRKFIELQMACNEEKVKNMLLKDIAYTLQVGREGMEERMAVIAGSMEELIEKLNAYLNNENQTINMFTGTKKTNTKAISDEQKIQIFSLFQNGRYEEIASMWTAGCSIDWESLYKETGWKNRRISLPTYPFARECY